MDNQMYCYECQEAAQGKACTRVGVCGKSAETARIQDLLIYVVKGVCVAAHTMREHGMRVSTRINYYIVDALFSTVTNVNFNNEALLYKVNEGVVLKREMLEGADAQHVDVPYTDAVAWEGQCDEIKRVVYDVGVLSEPDEELRALKESILYGLKGMAIYLQRAHQLGYHTEELHAFLQRTIAVMNTEELTEQELFDLVVETGGHCARAMALLDTAQTSTYGNPEPTIIHFEPTTNPAILVSGHNLCDLDRLLQQTQGSGVDVYSHGELVSAHAYPQFKKYSHFRGNYGGSWVQQRIDFSLFNGPILMTTNCLLPVLDDARYAGRLYTTGSVGFGDCVHIQEDGLGEKDFSVLIRHAKRCLPPMPQHGKHDFVIGYGHHQLKELVTDFIRMINEGTIRKIVVVAGCDGRQPIRRYYEDFVAKLPSDTIILTAGCLKYRFHDSISSDINGIPRLLDCGQCTDVYSIVKFLFVLRDAMGLRDVNELPFSFNFAWYDQHSLAVIFALLSMRIRNICLGS